MLVMPAIPVEATDPRFRQFYDYWLSCAPPGRLPGRQHIDPVDVPQLLPSLMLYDIVQEGANLRFRVRIAGEMLVTILGLNPAGRFIDEFVIEAKRTDVNAAFTLVARDRTAHYWENQLWTAGLDYIRMQRLALPLARNGTQTDMIIACHVRAPVDAPGQDSAR